MTSFKQIDEARKALKLGESASFSEIRDAYRKLSLKYHPDKCKDEKKKKCEEMFKKINHAHDILMKYCANYRFSFEEERVKEVKTDREMSEHLKRFYGDWSDNPGI